LGFFDRSVLLIGDARVVPGWASRIDVAPLIVTSGDPDDALYRTPRGAGYDGIASLTIVTSSGSFGCTGALLSNGIQVLTAAHCLTDSTGTLDVVSLAATFFPGGSSDTEQIEGVTFLPHPLWNGALEQGNDVAIVVLANPASAGVQRYDIYNGSDEIGSIYDVAGWGSRGTGDTGATATTAARRHGWNTFDATMADTFAEFDGWTGGEGVLVSDFDNGNPENDALGVFYEIQHLGLGIQEVSMAPGDSGAPALLFGQIAGLASFRLRLEWEDGTSSDIDGLDNASFGEFNAFTRVSTHAQWISSIPEPGTAALCAAFAIVAGIRFARRGHRLAPHAPLRKA
jgi:hypothetical protein